MAEAIRSPLSKFVPHPLLLFPILETIFENLDLESLKNCRLACYIWDYEAFRIIRKQAIVNVSTEQRQQHFLNSEMAKVFHKFSLRVHKWNQQLANHCSLNKPTGLDVAVDLICNEQGNEDGFELFKNLLQSHATILLGLRVHESWKSNGATTARLVKHVDITSLAGFGQLKKLAVVCGRNDPSALQTLWLFIIRNAPHLTVLDFRNFSWVNFWDSVTSEPIYWKLSELRYVHDRNTAVGAINRQILGNGLPVNTLKRLCITFHDFHAGIISIMLNKVAETLEVLEFHTKDQTALSPIDFPVMRKLKLLDAGNAQFSFPTLLPDKFPELAEIRATYWDWVFTRENLSSTSYYWNLGIPLETVTNILIRFPNWWQMELPYRKLENFEDFVDVLHFKFPSASNFAFDNVSPCKGVKRALESFAKTFEFTFQSFYISSYCTDEQSERDCYPIEIGVTEEESCQRELQVFDLCPEGWLDVWRKERHRQLKIQFDWIPNLLYYDKLCVLKVLWVKDLFPRLHLLNKYALPELQHLEFVGNVCVNRYERSAVEHLRPHLAIIQHRTCFCEKEDWWYMDCKEDGKAFRNLFAKKRQSLTWYLKKVLFHKLLLKRE